MASKLKQGTSNAYNLLVLGQSCQVNEALRSISPRWKMQILHSIATGTRQFSLLKHAFPSLSDQVLGKRLLELVKEELINKTVYDERVPVQVVYNPTDKGFELLKIIYDLHTWNLKW